LAGVAFFALWAFLAGGELGAFSTAGALLAG
jgi:hypothetical protein